MNDWVSNSAKILQNSPVGPHNFNFSGVIPRTPVEQGTMGGKC